MSISALANAGSLSIDRNGPSLHSMVSLAS